MLKRTPLKPRKKLLKRGKAPKRSPLVRKVVNRIKAKGKPRFKQGRDPQYLEWIRGLPCLLHGAAKHFYVRGIQGNYNSAINPDSLTHMDQVISMHLCDGRIEAAHVKSRGAGAGDLGQVVPLCAAEHRRQHEQGIKTWADRNVGGGLEGLRRIAAEVYPQQYERAKALGWPE